jgi:hypothetical protein
MRHLLIFLVVLCLCTSTLTVSAQSVALTRPAKAAERQAAIRSIQAQLQAFKRDDYKTAIGYQSSGLKKAFPTPEAFHSMMLNMYPEFAHYKAVTFGSAQSDKAGLHLALSATVTGQDGIAVHAVYLMVREGKLYRVEGVSGGAQAPLDTGPSKDV